MGGTVQVWDLQSQIPIAAMKPHDEAVYTVAFSAEEVLTTASADGTAKSLSLDSLETLHRFSIPVGILRGAVVSPNGKQLVTLGPGPVISFWEIETGRQMRSFVRGRVCHRRGIFPTGGAWRWDGLMGP